MAGGVTVLDVVPPPLRRRGAAAARAAVLSTMDGTSDEAGELRRRGLVRRSDLARMGVPVATAPVTADWHADPAHWAALRRRLAEEVARYRDTHPLEPGAPVETLRQLLRLPDRALVTALVTPPLVAREGRISSGAPGGLPAPIARAVDQVRTELAGQPFRAPDSERLAALGLGPKEIGAAVRAGALVRIAEGVVLLPDALDAAVPVLAKLSAPFTMAQAREALGTTRRVAVPLLELLDRRGVTRRLPDDTRVLAHRGGGLD